MFLALIPFLFSNWKAVLIAGFLAKSHIAPAAVKTA